MKTNPIYSSRVVVRHIRKIRENKRYSQEFMAKQMGISQEAYSRLELYETTPSVERLLMIAAILKVPARELLFAHL